MKLKKPPNFKFHGGGGVLSSLKKNLVFKKCHFTTHVSQLKLNTSQNKAVQTTKLAPRQTEHV